MVGLGNSASVTGHGQVIRHLARLPGAKTFVLMFGNVDLDFTYYRSCCLKGVIPEEEHAARCIAIYGRFLKDLLATAGEAGGACRICVLAPQPSPIRDAVFTRVTSIHGKVAEDALLALGGRLDLSHAARIARTTRFCDRLEREVQDGEAVRVCRIDGEMVGPDGTLLPRFQPAAPTEHHATTAETYKCWRRALSGVLDIYRDFAPKAVAGD